MFEAHSPVFTAIIRLWRDRKHTIFTYGDLLEDLNRVGVEADLANDLRLLQARGLIERREPDMVMLTAYGMSQAISHQP